ncbi:MAG: hypothetical protein FWC79_04320 [Oscillospiraceae bacterium]|nr:hypothetical protein [Oscillospiraceae bacterium]
MKVLIFLGKAIMVLAIIALVFWGSMQIGRHIIINEGMNSEEETVIPIEELYRPEGTDEYDGPIEDYM